ncbi:MAG: hypothetical protein AB7E37_05680 [Candidatus Altimarinota bacterium]
MAIDLETKIGNGRRLLETSVEGISGEGLQRLSGQVEITRELIESNLGLYLRRKISGNVVLEARRVMEELENMHTKILELLK